MDPSWSAGDPAEEQPMQPSAPQLGFEIRFRLTDGLPEDGALELWDDFVAGPVHGRGLACEDGDGHAGITRLLYRQGASATEADRSAIREWARRRGEIADYDVGPLTSILLRPDAS
jgi:uncharacterized protein YggL (DUF469 family)